MKIIESPSRLKQNAKYLAWSRREALKSSLLRMQRDCVKASYAWMLLPLSLLLPGCAAPSMPPCKQPAPISLPALTQPLPKQSYSLSAASDIQSWQQQLTGTSQTSKP